VNQILKIRSGHRLLLFFALTVGAYAQNKGDCKFSLKDEIPKNIKFTVQSGRIAFLCKTESFFLRGTVTRILNWQITSRVFETMAEKTNAETLDKWPSGRLYKIAGEGKNAGKNVICGYHSREPYSLELCAPENDDAGYARDLVVTVLNEFKKINPTASPLLKSAALDAQKKVFTEENETREPALLSLTMPPGYVEITRRENRALFNDPVGLAEMEIFYELSDLTLDSEIAHKVYKKSISAFLAKQGAWRAETENGDVKKDEVNCLIFSDGDKRLSHYCYVVAPLTISGKKKYGRIAFVVAYLREAVDRARLLEEQQTLLAAWASAIRKHSN